MNLPLLIAKRYLFSKKKQNVINIITLISVIGVAIGTMSLVIVLSVFNGFDGLIRNLFGSFDPDLKVLPVTGKTFVPDSTFKAIKQIKGVAVYSEVLQENALLKYGKRQRPVIIKGVDSTFKEMTGIDTMMVEGSFLLRKKNQQQFAVLGYGVALDLGVGLTFVNPIKFYAPKRNAKISQNPANAFNIKFLYPSGYFMIQPDFDTQYAIVPLQFARKLFNYPEAISAIEIKVADKQQIADVKEQIQQLVGKKYKVLNRFELHDVFFKMMQSEKAIIFLILLFILIIASFNVLSSLTMLLIDKKPDISVLKSLGATAKTIRKVFFLVGWLISLIGATIGVFLGIVICFLQIKFGLIKLSGGNGFIIENYPVEIHFIDIFIIFATVALIGYLSSLFLVRFTTKRFLS